jgi:hypothetical protein
VEKCCVVYLSLSRWWTLFIRRLAHGRERASDSCSIARDSKSFSFVWSVLFNHKLAKSNSYTACVSPIWHLGAKVLSSNNEKIISHLWFIISLPLHLSCKAYFRFMFGAALFQFIILAYKNKYLVSFCFIILQYSISKLYGKLCVMGLHYKFSKLRLTTQFNRWPKATHISLELQDIIREYAEYYCHMCGSTSYLAIPCKNCMNYMACILCVEICLEHNDICCKCCGIWGHFTENEGLLELLRYESR